MRKFEVETHYLNRDANLSNPATIMVLAADFGATLDLMAIEMDNCSQNNHAAVCIVYVLCN